MYEIGYDVILYSTHVLIADIFPGFSSLDLRNSSPVGINNIFSDFIVCNFPDFIVIYMDGSVSPLSAGYSFYISQLHISCTSNLPSSSSSFPAELFAIVEVLNFISTSSYKKFLIASDSMFCLQSLYFHTFNSNLSPLILRIKSILFGLGQSSYDIQFLWIPSHVGTRGNEITDSLAKSYSNFISSSSSLISCSDFTPLLRYHVSTLWSAYWNNVPANFASKFKSVVPNIGTEI
jgi:ribonuclease HI